MGKMTDNKPLAVSSEHKEIFNDKHNTKISLELTKKPPNSVDKQVILKLYKIPNLTLKKYLNNVTKQTSASINTIKIELKEENTKNETELKQSLRKEKKPDTRADKGYICVFCSYFTTKKCTLTAHVQSKHSKSKLYSCSQCDFKTSWNSALKQHIKTHSDKKHACDQCDYQTFQLSNLKRHMKVHTQKAKCKIQWQNNFKMQETEDILECRKCNFKTHNSTIFQMHLEIHDKQLFICDLCDYKTLSKFRLINHFKKHTENALFCSKCNFKCKRLETLSLHMDLHAKEPQKEKISLSCDVCGKKFRKHLRFEQHKKTHRYTEVDEVKDAEDVKYEICSICDYKSTRKHDMIIHRRSHTGEKPYKCEICPHRSSTTNHLTVHMRTHTGEKPYICTICGNRFSQNVGLRKHMKSIHK